MSIHGRRVFDTGAWPGAPEQVDSLLKFKSFLFLKEVQGDALSFLNLASDKNMGHLWSRDGPKLKQLRTVGELMVLEHGMKGV